jgi:hypothetical protein
MEDVKYYCTNTYDNSELSGSGNFDRRQKVQAITFCSLSTSSLIAFDTRFFLT